MGKRIKKSFPRGTAIVFEPKWAAPNNKWDYSHPLTYGEMVYFLSDIPNVQGHCIVAKYDEKVVAMVHPEDFRIAKDSEL